MAASELNDYATKSCMFVYFIQRSPCLRLPLCVDGLQLSGCSDVLRSITSLLTGICLCEKGSYTEVPGVLKAVCHPALVSTAVFLAGMLHCWSWLRMAVVAALFSLMHSSEICNLAVRERVVRFSRWVFDISIIIRRPSVLALA